MTLTDQSRAGRIRHGGAGIVVDDLGSQVATSQGRRRNMQANRRRDTGPELALRRLLHRTGLRYRVDLRLDLPTTRVRPDIVFTRWRVAVFVDGCFWHCCPEHGRNPTVNGSYWLPKLQGNRARDLRNTAALEAAGWSVVRVWEHESVADALTRVLRRLDEAGYASRSA